MTPLRDIEIVGGGLAGLSLGCALRRFGVPVTVYEAGRYPRHRVCGEFISGLDAATIDRLALAPLLADARPNREVAWFVREQLVRVQTLPNPALGLSRHALDARLAQAFQAAGGRLLTATRQADDSPQPGRVLATGRRRASSRRLGLKVHAFDLPLTRDLELHLGTQAYVGLSRVEGNRVNICGLFSPQKLNGTGPDLLTACLRTAGLPTLADRLAQASLDPASFCAVAALGFDRWPSAVNEMRLGDARAMIPPFTGDGMAMAFQSAALAVDPLLAYVRHECDWPAACAAQQAAVKRKFRLRLRTANLLHPFLLHPLLQRGLSALNRCRLLPLRPLYATLH